MIKEVSHDWTAVDATVGLRVSLERGGVSGRHFELGDTVELWVTLADGYVDGDLLWVCLPDALTRVFGGGKVKMFSVDFQGRDVARVSLVATAVTVNFDGAPCPQHFAVCVRNMFEEERVGSPGPISVTVMPSSASSKGLLGRAFGVFRKMFDE